MRAPITIILRSDRGIRRWSARHRLPPWLADLFDLATSSVHSAYAYLVTLFYTICYARHFYSRLRPLVTGSTALSRATPFPYLLRPFPYFLAFLGLMNLFKWLGVPWLAALPDWSALHYNIILLAATFLLPVAAVLAILGLLAFAATLKTLSETITSLSRSRERALRKVPINWAFFALIRRVRFWKGYRFEELVPAMLYCSINGIILWPIAFYAFVSAVDATDRLMNSDLLWEQTHSGFGPIWGTMAFTIVSAIGLLALYGLVLRPVLYAFVFRSQIPLLRRGVFPELLAFEGRGADHKSSLIFLDVDLEETSSERARFVWMRKKYRGGRVFNRLMATPKAR